VATERFAVQPGQYVWHVDLTLAAAVRCLAQVNRNRLLRVKEELSADLADKNACLALDQQALATQQAIIVAV
jgi:hypothetical protein